MSESQADSTACTCGHSRSQHDSAGCRLCVCGYWCGGWAAKHNAPDPVAATDSRCPLCDTPNVWNPPGVAPRLRREHRGPCGRVCATATGYPGQTHTGPDCRWCLTEATDALELNEHCGTCRHRQGHERYWCSADENRPDFVFEHVAAQTRPAWCPGWEPRAAVADPVTNPSHYQALRRVLDMAFERASSGKGKDRHASLGQPFEDQEIVVSQVACQSDHGSVYQIRKKALEASRMPADRAINEYLDIIVYAAAAVLVRQRLATDGAE